MKHAARIVGVFAVLALGAAVVAQEAGKEPVAKAPGQSPHIEIEHKATASEVMVQASRFVNDAKCGLCHGDGKLVEEVLKYPTGTRAPIVEPIRSKKKVKCEKCSGAGLARGPEFQRVIDDLVTKFVELNPSDVKAEVARQKVVEALQVSLKDKTRPANEQFNAETKRRTNDEPPKVGTPILMIGHLMEDASAGGGVGDARPLRIGMVAGKRYLPEEMNAFVTEAAIRKASKGDVVVIGGLFAGRQRINDRETAPVIQGGFVISLD